MHAPVAIEPDDARAAHVCSHVTALDLVPLHLLARQVRWALTLLWALHGAHGCQPARRRPRKQEEASGDSDRNFAPVWSASCAVDASCAVGASTALPHKLQDATRLVDW